MQLTPAPPSNVKTDLCVYCVQIPLPELPVLKTAAFRTNDHREGTTLAELPEKMKLMDRHFVSLEGMTKAFIVQLEYYPGTDIV